MKSKILLIGLPLFIVQLVLVYFITANILISRDHSQNNESNQKETKTEEVKSEEKEQKSDESKAEESNKNSNSKTVGQHLYTLDDIICNPAETNGKILVLTSIGFDMNSAESKKVMEEKTVILKDVVLNTISRKTVSELSNVSKRDSLKLEIIKNVEQKLPNVKINDLYFSKFIIQ
ncbi:MAG: flagellar basal body-associated FliL family protein [Ignavibacterium sp.]|nr:flagellar basal body-associated FliL family protein [Ignavibacterium sp.]MCX7610622.1 flagellar basal body-associated FliL family protein [Ignavibacterium sp.]MDW8374130.1 flagellar basal body-associated FliL family protein [Ignavibacteriales bacterium]